MGKVRNSRQNLGVLGESLAEHFLKKRGYEILQKNYRCRLGEIDLIAKESGEIAFVEVKSRRGTAFGFPEEQLPFSKQRRLRRLVQFYLGRYPQEVSARVDLVAILWSEKGTVLSIELIQNALSFESRCLPR